MTLDNAWHVPGSTLEVTGTKANEGKVVTGIIPAPPPISVDYSDRDSHGRVTLTVHIRDHDGEELILSQKDALSRAKSIFKICKEE